MYCKNNRYYYAYIVNIFIEIEYFKKNTKRKHIAPAEIILSNTNIGIALLSVCTKNIRRL